jgi:sugar transferase (PEP-CTERM system associated)
LRGGKAGQASFCPDYRPGLIASFFKVSIRLVRDGGGLKEVSVNRIFGQYFSAEMAVLCLIEWALTSIIIYALLNPAADSDIRVTVGHVGACSAAAMLALTIGAVSITIGLYRPELCLKRGRLLANAAIAGVIAFPALLLVSQSLDVDLNGGYLLWLAKGLIAWVACLLFTRWIFSFAMRNSFFVRRIMVLGTGRDAARTREQIQLQRGKFLEVAFSETMAPPDVRANAAPKNPLQPTISNWAARAMSERIWGIVVAADAAGNDSAVGDTGKHSLAVPRSAECGLTGAVLLDLKLRGIRVFDEMSFWEQHLGRINLDQLDAQWLTFADGFNTGRLGSLAKRTMDILVSIAVLGLTLPLMLITALLIKLDSSGPVFYRQERVGLHGRPFTLFKFRSMSVDAEAGGSPRWAARKDPRVTRVGGFIRSTRIDELPQLFNVLRGEMSFVGPRPERQHFVEHLAEVIPFYHERSYVKPGITGWAQVNFPYGASVEDARQKLSYDLYYVKNRSLFLDVVILFSTVRVILFREGAR